MSLVATSIHARASYLIEIALECNIFCIGFMFRFSWQLVLNAFRSLSR